MKKLLDGWKWDNKNSISARGKEIDLHISNVISFEKNNTRIKLTKRYGQGCVVETKEKIYANDFILMLADIIRERQKGEKKYARDKV